MCVLYNSIMLYISRQERRKKKQRNISSKPVHTEITSASVSTEVAMVHSPFTQTNILKHIVITKNIQSIRVTIIVFLRNLGAHRVQTPTLAQDRGHQERQACRGWIACLSNDTAYCSVSLRPHCYI